MKRNIFLFQLFLFSSLLFAQTNDEQKYLLTTETSTYGLSTIKLTDPYLSPISYSGIGLRYENESRRFLSTQNTNISKQSNFKLMCGLAFNPTITASMTYMGMNYDWGMHYHFRPFTGLQLLVGGLCDVDFGLKDISRNVNNPINLDLATNLNLSGVVIYDIPLSRKVLQLQIALQSPILGYMFVPGEGTSYYEIFELGNFTNTTHFSSLHNKRGINGTFSVDVPFKYSIWRFGFNYHELDYSSNNLIFKRKDVCLLIGSTFDIATFAGRGNRAPRNFISTKE